MKKLFLFLAVAFTSCGTTIKMIGTVNMISTRNIDHGANYSLLTSYAGGGDGELKKSKAVNIDEAINNTVKNIPGGEYVMNAKIYLIDGQYFAVEGDVWGLTSNIQHGYSLGDRVAYKKGVYGVITQFKSFDVCIVKDVLSGELKEVKFEDVKKDIVNDQAIPDSIAHHGYSVGDHVNYRLSAFGKLARVGTVAEFYGSVECTIRDNRTGQLYKVSFGNMAKSTQ